MKFTPDDVTRLGEAVKEIYRLKKFIAERAEIYVRLYEGEEVVLRDGNGFNIRVNDAQIFDSTSGKIGVQKWDSQGGGGGPTYHIPRDFIFKGTSDPKEEEYAEYLRLKKTFG